MAVTFAGMGFVAGEWVGPRAAAAAPEPLAQGAEQGAACEAELPPGHPPMGTRLALPPGHPPIWNHQGLPAGHPPIPSTAAAERLLQQLQAVSL